jgi:hypothetical protein
MAPFWLLGAFWTSHDEVAAIEATTIGQSERVLLSLR